MFFFSRNKSHHHQDHIWRTHTSVSEKSKSHYSSPSLVYTYNTYVSTVLQYFNAIINVNRMLICILYQPWNMIFGQPVCARLTFGSQLNIIFCLLYNSTRLSSTFLWGTKTCFSFRCQPNSFSLYLTQRPIADWTLLYSLCVTAAAIYILLYDTHSHARETSSALKRIATTHIYREKKKKDAATQCHFQGEI